ncbi:putative chaperone protein [Comamonas sp. BIGb0124]|uniref:Hsp70 family protein n=1 Tax=Comamonas sp. BIGb0124 TaxID=2485130 RepID=UPI000F483A68|nr:Hsp70 family protein [Comamonas sp. BIGb0124]ROR18118.1 putative chaperone protein [Comamonas sp. BIGb0124]
MSPYTLGIDFGTSNSAMAVTGPDGQAQLIRLEGQATAMPTALFFNDEERSTHYGRDAVGHYLAGTEGRLMRSLKSLLGSPLLQEKTAVHGESVSFQDIISRFLAELVRRAERQTGRRPERLMLGRPVHFVDDDSSRDQQAEAALRLAARQAGFADDDIRFQLEPIAAAFDYERRISQESLVLIVDIGGGTSDFTVVRLGPDRTTRPDRAQDILATSGVHIGGTDFDQRLTLQQVMPHLGLRHIGPQGREVPSPLFLDLSTWHLINWLYSAKVLHQAQSLRENYSDTHLHDRLMTVLRERLGHQVLHAVETAKIGVSSTREPASIDLTQIERGWSLPLQPQELEADLLPQLERVGASAQECLRRAGLAHSQIDAIYLTGGSSALQPLQAQLRRDFAGVQLVEGDFFGGVASGLAYATRQ